MALCQMLHHASGGALRLVLGIQRLVQRGGGHRLVRRARKRLGQGNRQPCITPARKQRLGQWIGMKTLQRHQHMHGAAHALAKQHVGGRFGSQHPFQRHLGGGGFQLQCLGRQRQGKVRACSLGPGLALVGRDGCHQRG
ncbi:hypothetical protein SDC9_204068 [bioreactor metagenome]|uniref:Uncharacterized protein n=1 Tax=bioreactor metagenome TaxID=1076179 RepID=A0A645IZP8_9ZZZZ